MVNKASSPFSRKYEMNNQMPPRMAIIVSLYHMFAFILVGTILLITYCQQSSMDRILLITLRVLSIGCLGGTLMTSRCLIYSVRQHTFDSSLILWQLFTPIHSSVIAGVGVLLLQSG